MCDYAVRYMNFLSETGLFPPHLDSAAKNKHVVLKGLLHPIRPSIRQTAMASDQETGTSWSRGSDE